MKVEVMTLLQRPQKTRSMKKDILHFLLNARKKKFLRVQFPTRFNRLLSERMKTNSCSMWSASIILSIARVCPIQTFAVHGNLLSPLGDPVQTMPRARVASWGQGRLGYAPDPAKRHIIEAYFVNWTISGPSRNFKLQKWLCHGAPG